MPGEKGAQASLESVVQEQGGMAQPQPSHAEGRQCGRALIWLCGSKVMAQLHLTTWSLGFCQPGEMAVLNNTAPLLPDSPKLGGPCGLDSKTPQATFGLQYGG